MQLATFRRNRGLPADRDFQESAHPPTSASGKEKGNRSVRTPVFTAAAAFVGCNCNNDAGLFIWISSSLNAFRIGHRAVTG